VSGLDDLTKSIGAGGRGGSIDDLLGGLGGGGLGGVLGGILSGGGRSGGLGGGNPLLRMLLPLVASMLMNGGLKKLLARLQAQGKGAQADSWVGRGANQPLGAADVREAMDDEELDRIAQQLGVSKDEAAEALAQVLPDVVDQATPEGELPDDDDLDRKFGKLHELGSDR
jgi:uncharacterized protein YidB (DUF937 family)